MKSKADADVPPCPDCGSPETVRIQGSRDGAHCENCDGVFMISPVEFGIAIEEIKSALWEEVEPPLVWLLKRVNGVLQRINRRLWR